MLADTDWAALLAPLVEALAAYPFFEPPFRISRDAVRTGAVLIDTPMVSISMSLLAKPPYDFVRDYAPVALAASSAFAVTLHPSVPANSVEQLIALARARPGKLNYGSSGTGTHGILSTGKNSSSGFGILPSAPVGLQSRSKRRACRVDIGARSRPSCERCRRRAAEN